MTNYRVFVINMDRDVARRDWIQRQLDEQNIAFERFAAVDGKQLNTVQRAYHQAATRSHLSTAEIGCLLSHLQVWQAFLESDAEYALILEDDLHFKADFASFLGQLWTLMDPRDTCVHRLETFNARITLKRRPAATIGKRSCYELLSNHGGAAAYVLNRKSTKHLLAHKDELQHLPDTEMFDPDRRKIQGLTVYQWLPAPCIQDMLHDSEIGLTSNLAGTRADERMGLIGMSSPLKEQVKTVFRPIYTWLYDLAIWPQGKARKSAKFG